VKRPPTETRRRKREEREQLLSPTLFQRQIPFPDPLLLSRPCFRPVEEEEEERGNPAGSALSNGVAEDVSHSQKRRELSPSLDIRERLWLTSRRKSCFSAPPFERDSEGMKGEFCAPTSSSCSKKQANKEQRGPTPSLTCIRPRPSHVPLVRAALAREILSHGNHAGRRGSPPSPIRPLDQSKHALSQMLFCPLTNGNDGVREREMRSAPSSLDWRQFAAVACSRPPRPRSPTRELLFNWIMLLSYNPPNSD